MTRGPAGSAVRSNIAARWYRNVGGAPVATEAAGASSAAPGRNRPSGGPRGGYASGLTSRSREPGSVPSRVHCREPGVGASPFVRAWAESSRAAGGRGGGTMATKRLRLLSLMAVGVLAFGACSSTPSGASGGGGADACAGTGAQGGANLQIPDVEEGKFNVAMVLIGPHDDGGWSQAHYEGLQYVCENVRRHARRLHRERARGRRLRAGLPEPRRARASTSSSAPRSATWTRWRRSPRSSPTSRSST